MMREIRSVGKEKVAIIGAGFYGLMMGKFLEPKYDVTIFESENDIMTKASSQCQMRIHSGMMYPRNLKTAIMCAKTFKLFMLKFKNAIISDFKSYYAIANDSLTTTEEFKRASKELGLPYRQIKNEFFDCVDSVFECEEYSFSLPKIKDILGDKKILLNTKIESLEQLRGYDKIFICAYSGIPSLLQKFELEPIKDFKTVNTEKIYFEDDFGRKAVCVIDGNYFTTMCLNDTNIKTLTATDITTNNTSTNYEKAFERVKKYIPSIEMKYIMSTFCEKSYIEGQRSCYVRQDGNIYTILGGKITNVFELFNILEKLK